MGKKSINPFIKASVRYFIATVIGQGMTFLGIVVFTRLMGQSDYGNYSTYYAFVSIFTVLIGANLFYALNNAYIDKKNDIKEFRKSVLFLSTIIMLIMLMVALVVGNIILHKISVFVVVMGSLHSYGFFLINYRMYSANMENDYKVKQWILILPGALQFVLSLIFILIFPNATYQARIIGSVIGVGCIAIVEYVEIMRFNGRLVNREYWKYALNISLPTIVMSISYMLMQQCDKVMITNYCGAEDTAIYSVIYYLGYALIAVDQAVAPVRQAWIFRKLDTDNGSGAKTIQKWYLIVMVILVIALVFTGPEIVKIIAPNIYWRYEYITPFVLSACMMVLYRFNTEILLFYKKNLWLSLCVLLCASINVALNAFLIPRIGAIVACYTTVIAYGLLFVITQVLAEKQAGKLYDRKMFIIFIVCISAVSGIYSLIIYNIIVRYIILTLVFLVFVIYMLHNQKEWKEFLWKR